MSRQRKGVKAHVAIKFNRDTADEMPERKLLAAVLLQAWQDCAGADLHEAFSAFRWAVKRSPMFVAICEELGADDSFVAHRFHEEFGERFRLVGEVAA